MFVLKCYLHFAFLAKCCNGAGVTFGFVNVDGHLVLRESALAPATEWEGRLHCWRFLRVEQGNGYWVGRREQHAVSAGEMVVIPPEAKGVVQVSNLGFMTVQHFHLCVSLLPGLFTLCERQWFEHLAQRSVVQVTSATHTTSRQFASIVRDTASQPMVLLRCRLVELAVAALGGSSLAPSSAGDQPVFAWERFRQLVSEETEREVLLWPVESLAARCNCTARHFSTLFRKDFGVSLKTHQVRLRLQDAATLLRESEVTIGELAYQCGYRHVRSFVIAFRRQFGCTPVDWRKRRSKDADCGTANQAGEVLTQS
jgi:AraC-like DNA-binding protein